MSGEIKVSNEEKEYPNSSLHWCLQSLAISAEKNAIEYEGWAVSNIKRAAELRLQADELRATIARLDS